jgi:hypothetical protein
MFNCLSPVSDIILNEEWILSVFMCAAQNQWNIKLPQWSRQENSNSNHGSVDGRLVIFYTLVDPSIIVPDPSHATRSLLLISTISFLSSLVTDLWCFLRQLVGKIFPSLPNVGSGEGDNQQWACHWCDHFFSDKPEWIYIRCNVIKHWQRMYPHCGF